MQVSFRTLPRIPKVTLSAQNLRKYMSTETLFANLPGAVRELVVQSSSTSLVGETDTEKKEVASWIAKASDTNFVSSSSLPVCSTLDSWIVATHEFR
jgi:hypothetical protein